MFKKDLEPVKKTLNDEVSKLKTDINGYKKKLEQAKSNGVVSAELGSSTGIPFSSKSLIMGKFPLCNAKCNKLLPSLVVTKT